MISMHACVHRLRRLVSSYQTRNTESEENHMSDNPFAPLTRDEMQALTEAEDAPVDPRDELPEDGGIEQQDRSEVLTAVTAVEQTAKPRTLVKRRIVRQVDLKHVAQDMLGHAIANVLGYWYEDEVNRKKLEELGVSREQFATVLLQQADRAAKTLGFEQAWQN